MTHQSNVILIYFIFFVVSEYIRNKFLIIDFWNYPIHKFNVIFPQDLVNIVFWLFFGVIFSIITYIISIKFSLQETILIIWLLLILKWLVVCNLLYLPFSVLIYSIPYSFFEVFCIVLILKSKSINYSKLYKEIDSFFNM